jgi:hypothetical protein
MSGARRTSLRARGDARGGRDNRHPAGGTPALALVPALSRLMLSAFALLVALLALHGLRSPRTTRRVRSEIAVD